MWKTTARSKGTVGETVQTIDRTRRMVGGGRRGKRSIGRGNRVQRERWGGWGRGETRRVYLPGRLCADDEQQFEGNAFVDVPVFHGHRHDEAAHEQHGRVLHGEHTRAFSRIY